jgi:hypothetical protein
VPSPKVNRKRKPPELKVVFDTSAVYTGSASDLVREEAAELIRANSHHADLAIRWYLPSIVVNERQFQMVARGQELLLSVEKLERLLGHNLNITREIMEQRVKDAIERERQALRLEIGKVDTRRVDWDRLIADAVLRRPPFEPGENEKGFRDALIVETFLQIVSESPATPKVCRIALVTGDSLLSEAVKSRSFGSENVRIVGSLGELKGLINTLVSAISEEFVAEIQGEAEKYFFEKDNKETLYYKKEIRQSIIAHFSAPLLELAPGADQRENGTWFIFKPQFIKKEGQRVRWATRIRVECKAYKSEVLPPPVPPGGFVIGERPIFGPSATEPLFVQREFFPQYPALGLQTLGQPTGRHIAGSPKKLVAEGETVFEIKWSASVTTKKRFSSARIEETTLIGTTWK